MSKPVNAHSGIGIVAEEPGVGYLIVYGSTVPADGSAGYAIGCIFIHIDGGAGTALYVNEGTLASSDFDAVTVA